MVGETTRPKQYHLRIFLLGLPVALVAFALIYGLALLPSWAVALLFGVPMIYSFGRLVELWAHRP